MSKKTLIVIAGPTAVGKTKLAIAIAQYFNTEIISADSRQIFMETRIGTAMPSEEDLSLVTHYLIASHHVTDYYNAWQFEQDALQILSLLFEKKDVVVLAGGSGLYIDAICNGIDEIPDIDPDLRKKIDAQFQEEGIEGLRLTLQHLDPEYYDVVDLQNPARLKRAIEICMQSGQPYSQFRKQTKRKREFQIVKIALNLPREELYERINKRVDAMVKEGLENEVRSLVPQKDCVALKTVGYREFFDYFDGIYSLAETIEKIKQNTRKYAKKQITWLKRTDDYAWFLPTEYEKILQYIQERM